MAYDSTRIREVAADPIKSAREAKRRTGLPVIGAPSSWIPDPLVMAAGGIVLRLPAGIEGRATGTRARAHLQASSCFFCSSLLEAGLEGDLDFLDGLLFVQTCDAQQNLSDIWKVAVPKIPVVDVYMPVNRRSGGAASYLEGALREAGAGIGAITGKSPTDDDLAAAMQKRSGVEKALADLYDARLAARGRVPALEHYAACAASSCLPADESLGLLEPFVAAIKAGDAVVAPPAGTGAGLACAITGSTLPYPGLWALTDALGVAIRDDDLSLGRRLFDHPMPDTGSPWARLARGMIDRAPGATKADAPTDRGGNFVRVVRRAGVTRAILVVLKFCDPWAWDAPVIADRLKEAGVELLTLEISGGEDLAAGPVRNRVEAWFEMDTVGDLF